MFPKSEHAISDEFFSKPWTTWVLAFIVFVVAALPRLTDLDVFIGPDEFSWVTRPANFFWALTKGDFASTYQTDHPGVFLMWVNLIITLLKYAFLSVTGSHPDLATRRTSIGAKGAGLLAAGSAATEDPGLAPRKGCPVPACADPNRATADEASPTLPRLGSLRGRFRDHLGPLFPRWLPGLLPRLAGLCR